jgi:hypothetical protein
VVHRRDLIVHKPANGIDVTELRPFVAALDDLTLPRARFAWQGVNAAKIDGILAPDHVLSVAINYDAGWTAVSKGHAVPVRPDGMGMIVLEPNCSGNCEVQMHWSQGWEPAFVISAFLFTLVACVAWCVLSRHREIPGTGQPPGRLA